MEEYQGLSYRMDREKLKQFYSLNDDEVNKFLNCENVEKLTIFRHFYEDYKSSFSPSDVVVKTNEGILPPPTYLLDKNKKLDLQHEDMISVSDIVEQKYLSQFIDKWELNTSDKIHYGLALFLCDVIIVEADILEKREYVKIKYSLNDEEVNYFLSQMMTYTFYDYHICKGYEKMKEMRRVYRETGKKPSSLERWSYIRLRGGLYDYLCNRRNAQNEGRLYNLNIFEKQQEYKERKLESYLEKAREKTHREDKQYDKAHAEWMGIKRESYKQKELKEELETQFSTLSKWQNNILEVAKGNYANGEILTQISIEQGEVDSWFTDFQAFCICKGYKEKKMLYDKFSEGTYTPQDQLNAHRFAMKMLNNGQGREMIGFLMSLPEETFKCEPFAKLFEMIQKEDFKGIEYKFLGKSETLKVGYHQKELFGKEYIEVRNAENRIAFIVNREGGVKLESNIEDKMKNKNITNILNVVYQFLERNDL